MANVIDTGTGAQANQAVAAAQSHLGETVPNSNWCANFVSQVFKEAGLASAFSASASVPTLVSEFSGKTSTNVTSAQPGDLIVFGNAEHVMMYEGSGQVIGTATEASGVTKVIETNWNNVYTDSGAIGPSMVLHTNLDSSGTLSQTITDTMQTQTAVFKIVQQYYIAGKTWDQLISDNPQANNQTINWPALATKLGATTTQPINLSQLTILNGVETLVAGNWWDGVVKTAQDAAQATGIAAVVSALGKLTNPANWLHLGAMLAGVALVGFGMVVVARDLGETGPQGLVSPMPIILKEGS